MAHLYTVSAMRPIDQLETHAAGLEDQSFRPVGVNMLQARSRELLL